MSGPEEENYEDVELPPELQEILDKQVPSKKTTAKVIRHPKAAESPIEGVINAEIERLAHLSPPLYEHERGAAAEKLGMRASVLDNLVRRARDDRQDETPLYPHWQVEPWHDPVPTAQLLDAILARIRRHVVMSSEGVIAAALWITITWVHDKLTHSPILMVTSAEANSGKSTVLGVISFLAHRTLPSVGISSAALFRSIEKWQPCFVIDEADTIFSRNEDLREVVNSGWTRGQGVVRCDPETNEPRLFSTFCPRAIGLKGRKLPDTTLSRSIVITMKRKLPGESAEDFEHVDDTEFQVLRRKLARWANDHGDKVIGVRPDLPEGFINRVAGNWRPLLASAKKD